MEARQGEGLRGEQHGGRNELRHVWMWCLRMCVGYELCRVCMVCEMRVGVYEEYEWGVCVVCILCGYM